MEDPDPLEKPDSAEDPAIVPATLRDRGFRHRLHESGLALVENACVSGSHPAPSGFENRYQLVLPYHGLFAYNVGTRQWLIDSTRILCVSPGCDFFDEHPVQGLGHAAVLISLEQPLVDELCGRGSSEVRACFAQTSVPNSGVLQLVTHRFLRASQASDPLFSDECVIGAFHHLGAHPSGRTRSSTVLRRAKQVLHAHGCDRLSLDQIAALVEVSPVYLTQEFTRSEGVPLYQYQMRLRLNRALVELPYCTSITELALDLGFSSHSHFTSVFRKAFGVTPSDYRSGTSGLELATPAGLGGLGAADHRHAA